ncbi:MAG: sucrase ferredoxin [Frankia sp.]|nr:sucrase ferredoxin [Frankia sp.]
MSSSQPHEAIDPEPDFRCAPWTQGQRVDPIGSALTCDLLVLVEVAPPWPHDVGEMPAFAELTRRDELRGARLLAVRVPDDEPLVAVADVPAPRLATDLSSTATPAGVAVTIWRRGESGGFVGADHVVASDRLVETVAALVADPAAVPGQPAPPEVLLCAHGRRDRCCGRLGTRLALDVAAAWPGVRVRRCSHTGGHRFAPTGFTLPDGRAWGFLEFDVLDTIVRRSGPPPLSGHYRGDLALDMWGQVAERELFARFGWRWLEHRLISAQTEVAPDRRAATVRLAWTGPDGPVQAVAEVEVSRDVPVLVCGEPPEKAKKASPELALRSIEISAGQDG